jgi:hypothetical protein
MGVCEIIELNKKLLYGLKECQCAEPTGGSTGNMGLIFIAFPVLPVVDL